MNEVSEQIEQKFYQVLKRKISLDEFEQWVYHTPQLEAELPDTLYTDLLSLNYKGKYAFNELENIILPLVSTAKFEMGQIKKHLQSIIDRDENCAEAIELTYDLYCKGYVFFRRLGLTYGLTIICPPHDNYTKQWADLSESQQESLLNEMYPAIIQDAQNALNWFNDGKIMLRKAQDGSGEFDYKDLRNKEEYLQGDVEVIDTSQVKKTSPQKEPERSASGFWALIKSWL